MTELERVKAELLEERKRVSAYKNLVESLEKSRNFYMLQHDWAKEAALQIESERKANELLTNEVEAIHRLVEELRSELRTRMG